MVGSAAGYFGGWVDGAMMRITEFILALPELVSIIVAARNFGDEIPIVVLIVSAITWASMARIVRGVTLSVKNQEFAMARLVSQIVDPHRCAVRQLPGRWIAGRSRSAGD